jgi:nitrite reductase (NADH) large subunit
MKIVVAGHGMVGHQFLSLAETGLTDAQVTVLCEEARPAYDRVHLSEFFAGKSAQDLSLVEPGFFERTGFDLRLAARAASVDRRVRTVTTADGEVLPYDVLVLATGSVPFVPPIAGRERPNCFVYRTIDDLEAMQAASAKARRGVVVGGGLLGLECAKALRDLGLETHVVEFAPRLMAVQVDESGGRILREKIEALGVHVHTRRSTTQITDGAAHRHRMVFEDGSHLETDMIVFSAGIRPRDELARQCVLAIGPRGGVVIDDHCRTSDPHLRHRRMRVLERADLRPGGPGLRDGPRGRAPHRRRGLGRLRGRRHEHQAQADGRGRGQHRRRPWQDAALPQLLLHRRAERIYKKIVVSEDGRQLLGAVLVGDAAEYGTLLQMALNGIALPEHPEA